MRIREISYHEALLEAIMEEMRKNDEIFIMGEDITFYHHRIGTSLIARASEFKERILATPISEPGFVGAALGAALTGMRPIVELNFVDLAPLIMDQINNQIAKRTYVSGGKAKVPLTILIPQAGRGSGADHSQSLEGWFIHIPGLKVAIPSTPYDVKGIMKTALRDNNPTIIFEHKGLRFTKGHVPEEEYLIPFGQADVKKEGKDATIVSWSLMLMKSLQAAQRLEKEGISLEIVDPRTLVPLDEQTIIDSIKKTGRLVIVEEECKRGGAAAEIAAIIVEKAFNYLKAPIKRVAAKDVPIPFARQMESFVNPQVEDIIHAVKEVV